MNKLQLLNKIKELYDSNVNIIQYLNDLDQKKENSLEDIMISYDFQAGTYSKNYELNDNNIKYTYSKKIAKEIDNLGSFNSILEAGIGEATTLGSVVKNLNNKLSNIYGFDISWSRIKYAQKFLHSNNINNVNLFTGDLFCTPVKDNSIDIVYTSHSIEPNGGKEKEALEELYRITNKYLILLEPAYEFATDAAKERMKKHGYITKLYSTAKELGYKIIRHELFGINTNPLNPTGIIIIEKESNSKSIENPLCCPITKGSIELMKNTYYCRESLLAYPIIDNIPCLTPDNAIVATKFLD